MRNIYYVYTYFDPRTEPPTPIYVGKGHGKRSSHHLHSSHNKVLKGKIQKIREMGLEPLVIIEFDLLTPEEAFHIEIETIAKYGRLDKRSGSLCNFTDGGEGTVGYQHSPQTRVLYSEQRKGKTQTPAQYAANCNRSPTLETCAKQSAANKGQRRHTLEQIEAIRESNRTRVISEETRELWSRQRKGKTQTPEHVAKVRDSKKAADEARRASMTDEEWSSYMDRIPSKNRGKKRSEETRAKMRAAWELRRNKTY